MPERDGYIAGVPCWLDTNQPDPEAAVDFYSGLFGWEFENVMPPEGEGAYYIARMRGGDVAAVGAAPESGPPTATWNTYIWVEDADATAASVFDNGGSVLTEPFDVMDAGRMAVLADPEGAVFCIWQPCRHKGARIVNEPGAVVFNSLATRDVAGAEGFYGAVFGWRALTLDGGFQVWALPGYGDHLEQNDPGLRARIAEMGATPGFEDTVASIEPIADGPARWSVTFAVEDADTTVAKAAALGATIVVPPTDAPWVRMSVICDPQGATFVASQFAPENRDVTAGADPVAAAA